MKDKVRNKAKKIKLLVLDVDGVLSDGRIIYDSEGRELKAFCARDGAGIKYLQRSGIKVAILSGRDSETVRVRAEELEVSQVIQGVKKKLGAFEEILTTNGLNPEALAYMGDDLMDLPILRRAGLAAAPADAVPEVKRVSDVITRARGGQGAVRELAELILKAQGKWKAATARYRE
jgi:3-deoxy-D-manno-octulosonate 8-phosphate phosphatase (KDO 8-P phosphatase)